MTSRTCSEGKLSSLDCNRTTILDTPSVLHCPAVQNTSILCGTGIYHHLPASWSGRVCTLVFLPWTRSNTWQRVSTNSSFWHIPIPVQHKRALQVVPFLVAAGVATGAGTGTAGPTTSLTLYKFLSQLDNGFQKVYETMLIIQKKIDSLAAVVLQNWQGLDVLTAKEGGLCLFFQEECCYYVNQSVRNKIQQLQSETCRFSGNMRPPIPGFSKTIYGSGYSLSWYLS